MFWPWSSPVLRDFVVDAAADISPIPRWVTTSDEQQHDRRFPAGTAGRRFQDGASRRPWRRKGTGPGSGRAFGVAGLSNHLLKPGRPEGVPLRSEVHGVPCHETGAGSTGFVQKARPGIDPDDLGIGLGERAGLRVRQRCSSSHGIVGFGPSRGDGMKKDDGGWCDSSHGPNVPKSVRFYLWTAREDYVSAIHNTRLFSLFGVNAQG